MFHDLIKAYADTLYVATTLRLPVSAASARESERLADCQERGRARSSGRLAARIVGWLRTRLGRGFAATAEPPAPIRPSFIRPPQP